MNALRLMEPRSRVMETLLDCYFESAIESAIESVVEERDLLFTPHYHSLSGFSLTIHTCSSDIRKDGIDVVVEGIKFTIKTNVDIETLITIANVIKVADAKLGLDDPTEEEEDTSCG